MLIRFDRDLREEYVSRIATRKFNNHNTGRDILVEELEEKYRVTPFKKAGYLRYEGGWEKPSVVVNKLYEIKQEELRKEEERRRKRIEQQKKKKKQEDAQKFKFVSKSDDGTVETILGQEPNVVYLGAGVLVLLLGAAILKK